MHAVFQSFAPNTAAQSSNRGKLNFLSGATLDLGARRPKLFILFIDLIDLLIYWFIYLFIYLSFSILHRFAGTLTCIINP